MNNNIKFQQGASLKNYCTFRIGGKAKFLYIVYTTNQLLEMCKYCKKHNISYKIIGMGANLLFDDKGFNGAIIVNKSNNLTFENNSLIVADSGVNVSSLIVQCALRNLGGMESLAGIPATVGGAIFNNLGAFDCSISDHIEYVECYLKNDFENKIILSKNDCLFSYRNSIFKSNNFIITKVKFKLLNKPRSLIHQQILLYTEKKKQSQPLNYPSAGSVFKRCEIIPSKVIDELGLKGTCIGGAKISTKHAGFIVNTNNASSNDVKSLISLIKNKVYDETGKTIDLEIEVVDFDL